MTVYIYTASFEYFKMDGSPPQRNIYGTMTIWLIRDYFPTAATQRFHIAWIIATSHCGARVHLS